jgi:hypothetical protein
LLGLQASDNLPAASKEQPPLAQNPQSLGGAARAMKLTSEERREIAVRAAKARWERIADPDVLPSATHQGVLQIGDVEVEVYRLKDNRRMISKKAMARALNLKSAGGNAFLRTMTRKGIDDALTDELRHKIANPLNFRRPGADSAAVGQVIDGYEGTLLIDVCIAIIEAKKKNALSTSQEFLAVQAEIIIRSAAKLGIIALIDEAVGFGERAKDEYRKQFQQFIKSEWSQWEQEFPNKFADMLYSIYGYKRFDASSTKHPRFFAKFTRKFIYHPLANSHGMILEMLDEQNPVVYSNGGRKYKLFQFLSKEVGLPAIRAHLWQVIGIGNASRNIQQFEKNFYKAFPEAIPLGSQQELDFDLDS